MFPLFNYLLWTLWLFYKLKNPTNWCFHTYFVTSYINTFLCLFPKAFIHFKLWNVLASALFQVGNTSDWVHWPDIKALSNLSLPKVPPHLSCVQFSCSPAVSPDYFPMPLVLTALCPEDTPSTQIATQPSRPIQSCLWEAYPSISPSKY